MPNNYSHTSSASTLLHIDFIKDSSLEGTRLKIACQYYGIDLMEISVSDRYLEKIEDLVIRNEIGALAINANSLEHIQFEKFNKIIENVNLPLLIFGLSPSVSSRQIAIWSGNSINCSESIQINDGTYYSKFSDEPTIARELSGQSLQYHNRSLNYFSLSGWNKAKVLIDMDIRGTSYPYFVQTEMGNVKTYLLASVLNGDKNEVSPSEFRRKYFYELAPIMIFVRHTFGNRCWDSHFRFANLVIDDPWLREPYGNLSYVELLDEMEKVNFHTTIAFIPWNYDRSGKKVVDLFLRHGNRFSISVHGNDHNHEEFYDLNGKSGAERKSLLEKYEFKIAQSRARMEKFTEITGIAYDPVMIFPHKIAPAEVLSLLRKYGYMATVNHQIAPIGQEGQENIVDSFRGLGLSVDSFPSFRRLWITNIREEDIAINLFLGNPVIFYTHQEYFRNSIKEFNAIADMVNKISPGAIWTGLGDIVNRYYLERIQDVCTSEVIMFSDCMHFANHDDREKTCWIKKYVNSSMSVDDVSIDKISWPFEINDGIMEIKKVVPPNASILVNVKYENMRQEKIRSIANDRFYYAFLRWLSDFRDISLSKIPFGQDIIETYYRLRS